MTSSFDLLPDSLFGAELSVEPPLTPDELGRRTLGLDEFSFPNHEPVLRIWSNGQQQRRARVTIASTRNAGTFILAGGEKITCHPDPAATSPQLRATLHSLVASLILEQQRRYALHATTTSIDGVVVSIAGRSGAGKSTSSLALVRRGAAPVVDDITLLDPDHDRMVTRSFGRPAHVFPHVVDLLGIDPGTTRPLGTERGKLAIDWPDVGPTPVDLVVVLQRTEVREPTIEPLRGMPTTMALRRSTHLRRIAERHDPGSLFTWLSRVAQATRVVRLALPTDGWALDDHCERIEQLAAGLTRNLRHG